MSSETDWVLVPRELLDEARNIAMEWTLKGRVPECGKFGQIAQDLDAALAAAPPADQAGPKRRPYNPSGSLSEYGIFPECDAALGAQAKDAEIEALKSDLGDYMDAANYQATRAERLAEALRDALECGNDGDWQSARQYITAALRDNDQEVSNG